jgi:hypothetical protein
MKPIYVKFGTHATAGKVEVATWQDGKLAIQKRNSSREGGGIYSETTRREAKTLKDAVRLVQNIYPREIVSA